MNKAASFPPITHIASGLLVVAPENPRSEESLDPDALAQLADNILAIGLLNPLIGYFSDDDRFYVTAGGRRTRAIAALIASDQYAKDTDIPIVAMTQADAIRAGHGEQLSHQRMSVLDELRLFAAPEYMGATDETLARYVAKSTRYVAQRRAILTLPDDVVEAVLGGQITVDQAEGLCVWAADPDGLAEVFKLAKNNRHVDGSDIRNRYLRRATPWDKSALTQIVPQEAYLEAGGVLQSDLFGSSQLIMSPTILEDLARELAPDWLKRTYPEAAFFTEAENLYDFGVHRGICRATEEEQEEWGEISWDFRTDDVEGLKRRYEEEGEEYPAEEHARWIELKALNEASHPDDLKAMLGVVWQLNQFGDTPVRMREYILPEDCEALYAAGYLERPKDVAPDTSADVEDAPEESALSNAMVDRIARIKRHAFVMDAIRSPNEVMALYLKHLTSVYSYAFGHTPSSGDTLGEVDPVGKTSAAWDKAQALVPKEVADVDDMKPAEARVVISLRMLECLGASGFKDTNKRNNILAGIDVTPKMIHDTVALEDSFFKGYKKPQKLAMIEAALDEVPTGLASMKGGALDEYLAKIYADDTEWLPDGF